MFLNKQEGDGNFSQISSEENDFQLDDELPSNMVCACHCCFFFRKSSNPIVFFCTDLD